MAIRPLCGPAGTDVTVIGEDWAALQKEEAGQADEFEIWWWFDDNRKGQADFTNQQSFQLSFSVPNNVSPGPHVVRVETREKQSARLKQCSQVMFCVVDPDYSDPWTLYVRTFLHQYMFVHFVALCDTLATCDSVLIIQVANLQGAVKNGGGRRIVMPSEFRANPSVRDADMINGFKVDPLPPNPDVPYYYRSNSDSLKPGAHRCPGRQICEINDGPHIPFRFFPNDLDSIIVEFEDNAFCAMGYEQGRWLGTARWRYVASRFNGNHNVVPLPPPTYGTLPSTEFMQALQRFNVNHGFTLPIQESRVIGGVNCAY